MLLGIWWWVSALTAAVIAACVSFLFLTKQRNEVATVVQSWGKGTKRDSDNDLAVARAAGAHAVGVLWGLRPEEASHADVVVEDVAALGPALLRLLSAA